ncbi:S9 family peptidase [Paucihalobacter ruber]|uniref:S9 family peptidase n=1 Tax=Paucihalobacter ruber TaxID=2567861 RepID=A0A506PH64_9FLAO|nr:S9 family peptidase [Paucihalobacter ruber]TPV32959.1 S9 family peptidase [Paucihalobacter ruber]
MNKVIYLLLGITLMASCKNEPKQSENEVTTVESYTIEQLMDNEAVNGGSFSHDNSKLLISSNRTGIFNLYTIPVEGGEFTPVTASDSTSIYAISFFPKDDRILFSADGNGDEINHIYMIDTDGTITDLTPETGAKSSFYGWAKDEQSFFFGSNKRDPRYFDIYQLNINDFSTKLIFQNDEGWQFNAMSDDEQYLAFTKAITTSNSDLFVHNLKTNQTVKVNSSESGNNAQVFSKDSSYLYYTTDADAEFRYLMAYELETGSSEKMIERNWDILGCSISEEGTYMSIFVNNDGKTDIEIINNLTGDELPLPDFGSSSISNIGFSKDESYMRMFVGGSNTPSDLYTYHIPTETQYRLTHVLNEAINPEDMVTATVVRFKSFDGVEVPAIYYLPHQASADNKVPAMIWVHGGPGGQTRQNYNPLMQYMLNQGYAVLAVNNRGSSGYGKTFYQMDDLNHGEKDLQDCVEGKNWLKTQPEIDPDKIGIMGGSYGGYMTMAGLTYTPEEFAVGVNIYGVTNWIRTLKSIPPYWEAQRKALYLELGDPYSADSVRLKRISPLFHTEKVTKPLMVLQGATDPRVLQVESDEIVAGVRANGVPVEYVLFEDEGHGFVKKENQIEAYSRIVQFLDKYLKADQPTPDGDMKSGEIKAE